MMDIEKEDSNSVSAFVGIFLHSLHGQQNTFIRTMSYSISIYYYTSNGIIFIISCNTYNTRTFFYMYLIIRYIHLLSR